MKRKKKEQLFLNLTSMTDMVFLLLIFFIIGTSFTGETKLKINLPDSKVVQEEQKKKPNKIIIELSKDNQMVLNDKLITFEQLDLQLGELAKKHADNIVVLKADKVVEYGRVVKVLGICMSHNLDKLGMAALLEKEQAQQQMQRQAF